MSDAENAWEEYAHETAFAACDPHRDFMAGRASVEAERDALRAQLDGMTTEWGVDSDLYGTAAWGSEQTAREVAQNHAADRRRIVKRLVGPWVEVE